MALDAKQIFELGIEEGDKFGVAYVLPKLRAANEGAIRDVQDRTRSFYYVWSSALVGKLKPKQVVELGGAMGVWSIMVLHKLPKTSILYSITLPEHGLEYSYVVDKYPNFRPVLGNDLDLTVWPKMLDFNKTDLWFFDALHTKEQLLAEFKLYSPFFKKGAIVLFDDIHLDRGMWEAWQEILATNKFSSVFDGSNPLHYSGYGVCVV